MDLHKEAKKFIEEQNYKGEIGEKGSTAEQNFKRLIEAVNIFLENGITTPNEADFENILKPAIAAKGRKQGAQTQDKTIRRTISLASKFYHWIKSKGDFQMNDNELLTTEERQAETSTTENNQPELYEAKQEQEAEAPKRGKPVTNGRSEKISLYMTKETFNRLDDLRKYDEASLQDLINEALEVYFKTRADDIKFLKEQEEERRARKARKAKEADND
ncbi:MAG: hypothetical protein IJ597_00035 [Synergistaceae bacterium]|nr:hypothetical protein [Synergistaceae bacterium]